MTESRDPGTIDEPVSGGYGTPSSVVPSRVRGTDPVQLLRRIRMALGVPQKDLAEAAGYARESVCQWELGHRRPRSMHIIEDLAASLGYSVEWTLVRTGPPVAARHDQPDDLCGGCGHMRSAHASVCLGSAYSRCSAECADFSEPES